MNTYLLRAILVTILLVFAIFAWGQSVFYEEPFSADLAAIALTGNSMPCVFSAAQYTVTVFNPNNAVGFSQSPFWD